MSWNCDNCGDSFCDGCGPEEWEKPVEPVPPTMPYTRDAVRSYVSDLVEQLRFPMDPKTYRATEAELVMWMQMLRDLDQAERELNEKLNTLLAAPVKNRKVA